MTDRAALIQALQDAAVGREVACADAHEIAAQFGLTPQELGETVNNATDLRFFRCQLGLFGYGLKSEGKSKIVLKAAHVPEEIAADLQARAAEGQISCADVWMVAA
ncbi:MAG TPA: hypothetical protein GX702_07190, partial [Chloroflexi bacterium]|nr:hypothetical protein [Chloroflexota bacterium]